jgi:hypothetical protein
MSLFHKFPPVAAQPGLSSAATPSIPLKFCSDAITQKSFELSTITIHNSFQLIQIQGASKDQCICFRRYSVPVPPFFVLPARAEKKNMSNCQSGCGWAVQFTGDSSFWESPFDRNDVLILINHEHAKFNLKTVSVMIHVSNSYLRKIRFQ